MRALVFLALAASLAEGSALDQARSLAGPQDAALPREIPAIVVADQRKTRPAEPLPPELAARYAALPIPESIALEDDQINGLAIRKGVFPAPLAPIPFQLIKPKGDGLKSLVIVYPILGGGGDLEEMVAGSLFLQGHMVLRVLRPRKPFKTEDDAKKLEEMFRILVGGTRGLLDWTIRDHGADPKRLGFVGISMGGITGTSFLAAEPRIRRSFIALAGADVPMILDKSNEPRLMEYLEKRGRLGIPKEAVLEDFRANLASDPLHLARYVESKRLLFCKGIFDKVIPSETSDKLWEALGRPARMQVPAGHYTSGAFYPYIMQRLSLHFVPLLVKK